MTTASPCKEEGWCRLAVASRYRPSCLVTRSDAPIEEVVERCTPGRREKFDMEKLSVGLIPRDGSNAVLGVLDVG
jgi:hypothetical protein